MANPAVHLLALALAADPSPDSGEPTAPPGEAEEAPPETAPESAPAATPAPKPMLTLGLLAGSHHRLPPASRDAPPSLGFAFAFVGSYRYAVPGGLELGAAVDLGYARHAQDAKGSVLTVDGREIPVETTRITVDYTFVALQTLGLSAGRFHAWAGVGGGLGVGHFDTEEVRYRPGIVTSTRLIARGALGVRYGLGGDVAVGLRVDATGDLSQPSHRTAAGEVLRLFGHSVRAAVTFEQSFL